MSSAQPTQPLKTVLVIDDDATITRLLRDVLQTLGPYRVITAIDGAQGLAACVDALPALILIDLRMPELDGAQAVRAIRGDPHTANIPIIMISAYSQHAERMRCLYSGADYYITKPFDLDALETTIARALAIDPLERAERQRALAKSGDGTTSQIR
jgi:CheY-like chemotaxis protein